MQENNGASNPESDINTPTDTPSAQQPGETPPSQTPETNSKKSKKWIVPSLIFIFFLLIGVTSCISYKYYQLKKETVTPSQTQPTTQETTSPTPTSDPTANWETYSDEKYSFSLKYPENWFVENGKGENLVYDAVAIKNFESPTLDIQKFSDLKTFDGIGYIEIVISKDKYPTMSIKDQLAKEREDCFSGGGCAPSPDEFIQELTLGEDNIPATLAKGGTPHPATEFVSYLSYQIKKDGLIYRIRTRTLSSNTKEIFDQILSTFKFTDETTNETANWKTYNNSADGYSVKYPQDWFDRNGYIATGINSEHYFSNEDVKYADLSPNGVYLFIKKYFDETTQNNPYFYFDQEKTSAGAKLITINGQPAVKTKITIPNLSGEGDEELYYNKVSVVYNEKIYYQITLESRHNQAVKDNESTFDQILSTFEFVE